MTRKAFLQLAPIDFWSRITHIVEMQHPLELGEAGERLRTAEDYLRHFWFKHVESFFNAEKLVRPSGDKFTRQIHRLVEIFLLSSSGRVCGSRNRQNTMRPRPTCSKYPDSAGNRVPLFQFSLSCFTLP
jgi:hypothetical protein